MQLIYHSWTPLRGEIGPSKNEVALPKILLKRRHNPEKGGLIKKWGGVGGLPLFYYFTDQLHLLSVSVGGSKVSFTTS